MDKGKEIFVRHFSGAPCPCTQTHRQRDTQTQTLKTKQILEETQLIWSNSQTRPHPALMFHFTLGLSGTLVAFKYCSYWSLVLLTFGQMRPSFVPFLYSLRHLLGPIPHNQAYLLLHVEMKGVALYCWYNSVVFLSCIWEELMN